MLTLLVVSAYKSDDDDADGDDVVSAYNISCGSECFPSKSKSKSRLGMCDGYRSMLCNRYAAVSMMMMVMVMMMGKEKQKEKKKERQSLYTLTPDHPPPRPEY